MSELEVVRTDEIRPDRVGLISAIFERWKVRFCAQQGCTGKEGVIIWRPDVVRGYPFDAKRITEIYFTEYKPAMSRFMKLPQKHNLDRHKIVALTQKVIMEHLPITTEGCGKVDVNNPPDAIVALNSNFALYFGFQFISRWHELLWEQNYHRPFPTDQFCDLFYGTELGKRFICEHNKYLMSELHCRFPAFIIAQLWFALEQWGLAHLSTLGLFSPTR